MSALNVIQGFDVIGDKCFSVFETERQIAAAVARLERIESLPPGTRAQVSMPVGGTCDITLWGPIGDEPVIVRRTDGSVLLDTGIPDAEGARHWCLILVYPERVALRLESRATLAVGAVEFQHECREAS